MLEGIDKAKQDHPHPGLLKLEEKNWREYMKVVQQEELIWFQKSRCSWLQFGDKNTSFFHASAVGRRKRNRTEALQDESGEWITEPKAMQHLAVNFFKDLYTKDEGVVQIDSWPSNFPELDQSTLNHIHREFT